MYLMTAQIVIINKRGAVLASDSAATSKFGDSTKTFNSSTKLVVPNPKHPIAFMNYGSAEIAKVPVDLLIELYGKKIEDNKFDTLEEYVHDFIKFLESGGGANQEENNWNFFEVWMDDFLYYCQKKYRDYSKNEVEFEAFLKTEYGNVTKQPTVVDLAQDERTTLQTMVETKLKNISSATYDKDFLVSIQKLHERMQQLIMESMEKDPFFNPAAIVVSGYGEKDIYPRCIQFQCEGYLFSKLRKTPLQEWGVTGRYMVSEGVNARAWILRFAQNDGARTFMHGVDVGLEENTEKEIQKIKKTLIQRLEDKNTLKALTEEQKHSIVKDIELITTSISEEFMKFFVSYKQEKYLNPIMDTAVYLELEEMVDLAKTLVNLTIIRRKYSMGQNVSAGGPVDVCVITKNQGAMWAEKKAFELKKG